MKLESINYTILESKFPVWDFIYKDYSSDPSPRALVLGAYDNPKTGNRLIAAVNTRLLSTDEAIRLYSILDQISTGTNLRNKVRILRKLSGGIFDKAYRTYNSDKIESVKKNFVYSNDKLYTKHRQLSNRIKNDSIDTTGKDVADVGDKLNNDIDNRQEPLNVKNGRKDANREIQKKNKPGPTGLGKSTKQMSRDDEDTGKGRDNLMDDEEYRSDQQRTEQNTW